jgi:two-component system, cell cycle sensor histidine kinase and response regulator CckA
MAGKKVSHIDGDELRRVAEVRFGNIPEITPGTGSETSRVTHELEVHKIELEMQNNELTKARDEMEAMLEKYTDLFEFAPVSYFTLDSAGVIRSVNQTGAILLGMERSLVNGRRFETFLPAAGRAAFAKFLQSVFTGLAKETCEVVLQKTDKSHFFVQIEAIAAASGEECRVALVDVSERRRAEDALRASEERHRSILHMAMDGYWLLDQQKRILEVNESYCKMSGYTKQELLGRESSLLDAAGSGGDSSGRVQKFLAQGEARYETRHRRKDGTTFDVEVSVQYLPVEGGRLVVFLRDISKLAQADREKALLEAQLLQAQKMESVGRLAGGVAHDFNNMLSVIIGNTNLALMDLEATHPVRVNIEEIRKAAERSTELTRQLLTFARKQTIIPKVLDLNLTVAGMLTMLKQAIGENIMLNWLPEADLWPVMVDPNQVDQILVNLCVNARDSITGVGKISIETNNRIIDADDCARNPGCVPGEYVRIAISDNGCGMDKDTLAQIFEPFFTTKGPGKGTGLGLSTVYGITKQNNGFINVSSEPGSGTAVTINLPRHRGVLEPAVPKETAQPLIHGQETILLVEDELAILNITTVILRRLGYTVLAAQSPERAIQLARENSGSIHLLMTDVVMPEMSGRDLAKRLQSLYPHFKCLFMSGYTTEVIAHHGVLDEGIHFIQKPFSIAALAAKLREALDGGSRT